MLLVTSYYADLWMFLPYVVLYIVWWITDWPISPLVLLFQQLHVVHLLGLVSVLWFHLARSSSPEALRKCVFWIVFGLLLWLPGAYLEYPSDPWEHLRRLMRWQAGGILSDYPVNVRDKFAYLFGWTLLSEISPDRLRAGLDMYAAAWQMLVVVQVYRLMRLITGEGWRNFTPIRKQILECSSMSATEDNFHESIGGPSEQLFRYSDGSSMAAPMKPVAKSVASSYHRAELTSTHPSRVYDQMIQPTFSQTITPYFATCLFFIFFGTNIFGLRYYGLSSSLLAYAAYLQGLLIVLRGSSRISIILSLCYLATLAFLNHKQELLFLGFMLPVAWCYRFSDTWTPTMRKTAKIVSVMVLLVGCIGGVIVREYVLREDQASELSIFGGFPIWNSFYFTTLGVVGWVGAFCALVSLILRRGTALEYFVLTPFVVLIWPPSAIAILKTFSSTYLSYRMLYAMPAALGIVSGVRLLSQSLVHRTGLINQSMPAVQSGTGDMQEVEASSKTAAVLGWILLGASLLWVALQPMSPWRGRLWFALYRAPGEREYVARMPAVGWFARAWDLDHLRQCLIVTDDVTRTLLAVHLGFPETVTGGDLGRRGRKQDSRNLTSVKQLQALEQGDRPVCGVLVATDSSKDHIPPSDIARLSGHWREEEGDLNWHVSDDFRRAAHGLLESGWKRIEVPGGYELYTPPSVKGLKIQ